MSGILRKSDKLLPALRSLGIRGLSSEAGGLASVSKSDASSSPSTSGRGLDLNVTYPPHAQKIQEILDQDYTPGASPHFPYTCRKRGHMIKAKVLQVDKKKILLDTGVKFAKIGLQDITPDCILSQAPGGPPRTPGEVRPGDVLQVFLEYEETPEGDMLVSGQQAAVARRARAVWKELTQRAKNGELVKGRILNSLTGGFAVGVAGLTCFLPATRCSKAMASRIGELQDFKIVAMSPAKNNVVLADPRYDASSQYRRPLPPGLVKAARERKVIQEGAKIETLLSSEPATSS